MQTFLDTSRASTTTTAKNSISTETIKNSYSKQSRKSTHKRELNSTSKTNIHNRYTTISTLNYLKAVHNLYNTNNALGESKTEITTSNK